MPRINRDIRVEETLQSLKSFARAVERGEIRIGERRYRHGIYQSKIANLYSEDALYLSEEEFLSNCHLHSIYRLLEATTTNRELLPSYQEFSSSIRSNTEVLQSLRGVDLYELTEEQFNEVYQKIELLCFGRNEAGESRIIAYKGKSWIGSGLTVLAHILPNIVPPLSKRQIEALFCCRINTDPNNHNSEKDWLKALLRLIFKIARDRALIHIISGALMAAGLPPIPWYIHLPHYAHEIWKIWVFIEEFIKYRQRNPNVRAGRE